jgi:zinc transporter ZupT
MNPLLLGVLVVLLSVVVALAGLLLVRRLVPLEHPESDNEATSTIHHAIAIVFGVAAAFAIFLVWEQAGRSASSRKRSRVF